MINRSILRFFSSSAKKHVFLLGAPGVGKTFYGAKMAADHNYDLIVLGDEIKSIATDSSTEAYKQFYQGKLVDDDTVFDLLKNRLEQGTTKNGFIIEGFPRTPRQLELYLGNNLPIDLVLNFTLQREVLEKRILGRLTCSSCKSTYNYFSFKSNGLDIDINLPKKEGVCDDCGGEVKPRPDDSSEIAANKMKEYFESSGEVVSQLVMASMSDNMKKYNVIEYSPVHGTKNYKDFASKVKLVYESL